MARRAMTAARRVQIKKWQAAGAASRKTVNNYIRRNYAASRSVVGAMLDAASKFPSEKKRLHRKVYKTLLAKSMRSAAAYNKGKHKANRANLSKGSKDIAHIKMGVKNTFKDRLHLKRLWGRTPIPQKRNRQHFLKQEEVIYG